MNNIVKSFEKIKVAVLGDIMLDVYVHGHVSRISPEAPVPVLNAEQREARLGGAGNVALNLKSLGAEPVIYSVIGCDESGMQTESLLSLAGIDSSGLIKSPHRTTTRKTRLIGNRMQMLRIDEEIVDPLHKEDEKQLLSQLSERLQKGDIRAIIFVDYDKGVLTETCISAAIEMANRHRILTTVDPKLKNFNRYKGVSLFKPNRKELYEGLKKEMSCFSWEELEKNMQQFAEQQDIKLMMVTLSEHGMALYERETGRFYREEALLRHISDVSGAGDTVIAVATLALCAGMKAEVVMKLANLAGGIVCEYAGVTPIEAEKLDDFLKY
jgi:rfaE bifunctional protein kinase chain/domain